MSRIRANTITNQNANGAPNFPDGITVSGVVTATTLNQTSTSIVVGSAVTANSTGIDVTGIATATNVSVAQSVTATTYYGSGANLTGIDASAIKFGGAVKVQANNSGAVVTGILTATSLATGTNAVVIPSIEAKVLVIGGGGGAGTTGGEGGGGGAGGFLEYPAVYLVKGQVYTVVVGAGGAGTGSYDTYSTKGAPSSIKGANLQCMPCAGGGGGGTYPGQTPFGKRYGAGQDGASGGGGGGNYSSSGTVSDHTGGRGIGGQGFNGGAGGMGSGSYGGGGGGGAGEDGESGNLSNGNAGDGGDGLPSAITGSVTYYAGGGAGNSTATDGTGGQGGGANTDASGTANTGGGGGAGSNRAGGSGVVIIRVKTSDYSSTTSGSPTVTTTGSDTVIKFTGSGTYTA